jgi:hypothetical protein
MSSGMYREQLVKFTKWRAANHSTVQIYLNFLIK